MLVSLVLRNLTARKARTLLTGLAIAASVALVVAITSGIAGFQNSAMGFMDRFMGAVDAEINSRQGSRGLNDELVAALRRDPVVRQVSARLNVDVQLDGKMLGLFNRVELSGVDKATDPPLDWLRLESGRWFTPGENACVIDQSLAEQAKLKVGDTFKTRGAYGPLALSVVGVVHKPGLFSGFKQTAYAPVGLVQKFFFGDGPSDRYSIIRLQFVPGTDGKTFVDAWRPKVKAADDKANLKLTRQTREDMAKNFLMLRLVSMLAGAVTMVAAAFIIVATLSMGVAERQRVLAMLRAVGASKTRVFGLVVLEGVGLGVVGILIGVPLGFAINVLTSLILRHWNVEVLPTLDWLGVLGATLVTLVTALLASLWPAWQASRVNPLEAMSAIAAPPAAGPPWKATLAGLLVAAIDPYLLHGPLPEWHEKDLRVYGHFVLGLPALMIGFFLLAPLFVWVVGRVAGPLVAKLFGAPAEIVRQQFVSGLWRLAGTCAALMVGLAVLVVMQVQGKSALASWKLPDKFPDLFLFTKSALTPDQQQKVADSPLLRKEDVMPVGTFSPQVGGGLIGLLSTQLPGATMFVAIDPTRAFRLMELEFRQGNPTDAARLLAQGHHVLITEELHTIKKLNLGDTLTLKNKGGKPIDFTVAGVVWSPGIDVMVSTFDVQQQFEQQSLACVFGSLDDAKNLFGEQNVYIMSANFKDFGTSKDVLIESLRQDLNDRSLFVADVRQLKHQIEHGMGNLLLAAGTVAWAALIVASLGVANTIVAGVRTRSWQFGILRSVGLLRGVLLRVVLAEAVLLGLTGALMGLACGIVLTFDSRALVAITLGHHSRVVVPWDTIGLGVAAVVALSVVAGLLPAWRVSRTDPLTLLQAGRSAA